MTDAAATSPSADLPFGEYTDEVNAILEKFRISIEKKEKGGGFQAECVSRLADIFKEKCCTSDQILGVISKIYRRSGLRFDDNPLVELNAWIKIADQITELKDNAPRDLEIAEGIRDIMITNFERAEYRCSFNDFTHKMEYKNKINRLAEFVHKRFPRIADTPDKAWSRSFDELAGPAN